MTPLQWAGVTAASAVLLAGVTIVAGEAAVRPSAPATAALETRINRAYSLAEEATSRLRQVTIRDSLRVVLRDREWPAESLLVVLDPQLPAWRAGLTGVRARKLWTAARPMTGGIRVAFVALGNVRGNTTTNVLLPDAFDGRTCVVVHNISGYALALKDQHAAEGDTSIVPPAETQNSYSAFQRRWQDGELLGPCAFYAVFGAPGPKVRAWLDTVEFYHAAAPNFWSPPEIMPPWYRSVWTDNAPTNFGEQLVAYLWRMTVRASGPDGAAMTRCASGKASDCADVLLARPRATRAVREQEPPQPGMPFSGRYGFFEYVSYIGDRSFRDFRPRLLADMAREVGVDRFRKIWTSTKPIDEAYADATGTPFEIGMMNYARRSIGGAASIGPSLPVQPVVTALVIVVILLVGVSARLARREHR